MSPMAIVQLLKAAKLVRDYVVKDNNLDQQMGAMQKRVAKLEKASLPCSKCKCKK
tara:strand:- start:116 stop:280 length:165 start_codon:yes stop_codon:yes gene_type:complete